MEHGRTRAAMAEHIVARLTADREALARQYATQPVPFFAVDNLLPEDVAQAIARAFPPMEQMTLRDTIRERKYVTAQMNKCDPLVEEAIFAFHDPRVVDIVAQITGLQKMEADHQLYAGGISVMGRGHYLNPHLDNSHDKSRERYRVLNLLYYTSPGWKPEFGGSLELWPDGPDGKQVVLPSAFNRLIVMATGRRSWHSVNEIRVEQPRCCVSNYYFSSVSPEQNDYFHPTSFRGRPEQPVRDLFLRADAMLRALVRRVARRGVVETKHYYRRDS